MGKRVMSAARWSLVLALLAAAVVVLGYQEVVSLSDQQEVKPLDQTTALLEDGTIPGPYAAMAAEGKDPVQPNPNEEPVELELGKIAKMEEQAKEVTAQSASIVKDFESVAAGKVSAEQLRKKYSHSEELLKEVAGNIDHTSDRCQDFYQHACGGWKKKTPIPHGMGGISRTFGIISTRNDAISKEILSNIDPKTNMTADEKYPESKLSAAHKKKIRDFYNSCMDMAGRNARGANDLSFSRLLGEVKALSSYKELLEFMGPADGRVECGTLQFEDGCEPLRPRHLHCICGAT